MRVSARKATLLGLGLVLPQELEASSSTHRVLSALILLKDET